MGPLIPLYCTSSAICRGFQSQCTMILVLRVTQVRTGEQKDGVTEEATDRQVMDRDAGQLETRFRSKNYISHITRYF